MKLLTIKLLIVAVLMFAATSAFADYSYNFAVDTSSVAGQQGYVDLMFNPGNNSLGSATAAITNFNTDAALGTAVLTGGATGVLPGTVSIHNNTLTASTPYNDDFQQVTFGNNMNFSLNLSGAAGNSFLLYFYDGAIQNNLLTNDSVNGIATQIDMNQSGAVVTNNSNQITVTPIPAAAYLFGSGIMGLVGIRRKIKN